MKTRFEANVASEVPKTKASQEPDLPWKVRDEDLDEVVASEAEYNKAVTGTSPFKTRAVFIIALLVTIFGAVVYYSSMVVVDKEEAKGLYVAKEKTVTTLRSELEKISSQNEALNKSISDFEEHVKELNSQKELFTAVIESLTKKAEVQAQAEPGKIEPAAGFNN